MKRIINEISKDIEIIKKLEGDKESIQKLEYVLSQLRLWFMCKKNYINYLPDYEIANLEKLVSSIDLDTRSKFPDIVSVIDYYFFLIKISNYELYDMLDKKLIKKTSLS